MVLTILCAVLALGAVALLILLFAEKKRSDRAPISAADGRGNEIGRLAGRAVGDGINAAKRLRDARKR